MRTLPRRFPSESPSLAWVAFAVLALAVAGGIGGLYAHRQNQETTKRRELSDLRREIDELREKNSALEDEFESRALGPALQLAVKEKRLPLVRIAPGTVRDARAAPSGVARNP
jgi:hypothetical protein